MGKRILKNLGDKIVRRFADEGKRINRKVRKIR